VRVALQATVAAVTGIDAETNFSADFCRPGDHFDFDTVSWAPERASGL